LAEQLARVCQRQSGRDSKRLNGQWDRLFNGLGVDQDMEIGWEDFQSFYAGIPKEPSEFMDILELSPEVSRHAHYKCDLVLVSRLVQILFKSALQDTLPTANGAADADRRCTKALKHDGLYTNCLLAIRLLHLCNYDYADVVLVLAYASVYFRQTFGTLGNEMSPTECSFVMVLLIFLAHVFLLDETCPLRIWQKHIFRQYCTLKVLNAALFRVFQMRPGLSLRITDEEERMALLGLSGLRYSLQAEEGEEEEPPGSPESMAVTMTSSSKTERRGDGEVGGIPRSKSISDETTGHCTTTDESLSACGNSDQTLEG